MTQNNGFSEQSLPDGSRIFYSPETRQNWIVLPDAELIIQREYDGKHQFKYFK